MHTLQSKPSHLGNQEASRDLSPLQALLLRWGPRLTPHPGISLGACTSLGSSSGSPPILGSLRWAPTSSCGKASPWRVPRAPHMAPRIWEHLRPRPAAHLSCLELAVCSAPPKRRDGIPTPWVERSQDRPSMTHEQMWAVSAQPELVKTLLWFIAPRARSGGVATCGWPGLRVPCSTCHPSGSHPSPSLGPLDFEPRAGGHVGYADSTPLKGHYGGGAGLGLTLQGSTGLRNTCHPVLTHLTDLPLATGYTVPGFHFN